ncbi:MAG: hypothetical protein JKY09_02185 [Crocinitomicaceae bacterium]|nr:hypothetical protein [Crocinitomicaceae bacterium]
MKKKYTFTTLIITAILVIIGILSYYKIIRPIYLNNMNQVVSIDLSKEQNVALGKYKNQKSIYGIELEISGKTSSNFDLMISNGEQNVHAATIKGGEIDFVYKNDWYSDSCFLYFLPRGDKPGKLTIYCRFLALN